MTEKTLLLSLFLDLKRLGYGTDDAVSGGDLVDVMYEYFKELEKIFPEEV